MIEAGPQEAATAAWDALSEAVERSKHVIQVGQPDIDRATKKAHLWVIEDRAFAHLVAVRALAEAMGG